MGQVRSFQLVLNKKKTRYMTNQNKMIKLSFGLHQILYGTTAPISVIDNGSVISIASQSLLQRKLKPITEPYLNSLPFLRCGCL